MGLCTYFIDTKKDLWRWTPLVHLPYQHWVLKPSTLEQVPFDSLFVFGSVHLCESAPKQLQLSCRVRQYVSKPKSVKKVSSPLC